MSGEAKARCIIFLDVDGVLNSLRSCIGLGGCRPEHLDRVAMGLLNQLCGALRKAGYAPEVVLSSTWRILHPQLGWWRDLFSPFPHVDFVGMTEDFSDPEPNRRGREVAAWMAANAPGVPFVCLDDDADFLPDQPLVLTSFLDGLQVEHINTAHQIITGNPMFVDLPERKWPAIRLASALSLASESNRKDGSPPNPDGRSALQQEGEKT